MTTVIVVVPAHIEQLIAERDEIISRGLYRKGDGERLYQIQVRLCAHFCDSYARAV